MSRGVLSSPPVRRVTASDVAQAAGVSQSTVSRSFSDDPRISPTTRAHVHAVATRMGYTPNALARSLITNRSGMVAVIATQQSILAMPQMLTAISQALGRRDQRMLLFMPSDESDVQNAVNEAWSFPLEGAISCVTLTTSHLDGFRQNRIPVVLYNRRASGLADSACTCHHAAAADVAQRLWHSGHRRFLCLAGPEDAPVGRERALGFAGQVRSLGGAAPQMVETDFSYDGGHRAVTHALQSGPRPDAVFCVNDQLAMGACDALRYGLNLSVPRDVSVVGFDDIPEAARPAYQLTTLRQDLTSLAQRATALLEARRADPEGQIQELDLQAVLVQRQTARF
ncbi:Catabolite control protein A [Aquimixticola soesokkakensis]|uniref:Catabolite control protein A n=1 Tax=Aquimixticola soesokkakensis TaxID=1519096 RepID=A0A1Y5THL3_9RHOB|nr:LacI family DNA-binding transcriptional regulator [Aquimixticola soesokkakensis]SLN64015.1 Catabolite control protein A [Aquimixticola soesokkakensis]